MGVCLSHGIIFKESTRIQLIEKKALFNNFSWKRSKNIVRDTEVYFMKESFKYLTRQLLRIRLLKYFNSNWFDFFPGAPTT